MHAGFGFLSENRDGGQLSNIANRYGVNTESQRYEAYMKHAYLLNREHNTNIALLATIGAMDFDGIFGAKKYGDLQGNLNAQLMLEHEFDETHSLSAGFSYNGEVLNETLDSKGQQTIEHVPGIYAQYTYNPSYKLTIMAGLRGDYSSQSGFFATPRLHLKWVPATWLTLRASAGKGYRTSHPLAENHYLLASGRKLSVSANIPMEEAWNSGISAAFVIPTGKRNITLNAEYYYTHFLHQAVVDFDSNPFAITIDDLAGLSYSHTAQIDASYSFTDELEATAAFRYNHVMCTYAGILMEKPLQSRYKGLLTISWKPRMGLWHIDFTLQMNGGGRMPKAYLLEDGSLSWDERFAPYPQLNLQVSREFRHFTIYVGGENLTNYRQPTPIINADNPWGNRFEPSLIWGPVHGIMAYAGVRMNFWTKNN